MARYIALAIDDRVCTSQWNMAKYSSLRIQFITSLLVVFPFLIQCALLRDVSRPDDRSPEAAARYARQIMATANIGFLGSVVGSKTHGSLGGYPMATMEYFATTEECLEDGGGDPIFLMSPLQAALQNVFEDNRVSLGVRSPQPQSSLPIVDARFSLVGKLEPLNETMAELAKPCYMRAHPEAKWAYAAHDFKYWVLKVDEVYYVGGFGGEHYIGWIDQETWGSAMRGKHDDGGLVYQQT